MQAHRGAHRACFRWNGGREDKSRVPVNLPLNADGIAEVLEGKPDNWLISFAPMTASPNPEKPKPLAQVSSLPAVRFISEPRNNDGGALHQVARSLPVGARPERQSAMGA